tara:strand:+ start:352 stop:1548 length:1197 start_codon:yes stop_codon:yes gene_type:complete
MAIDYRGFAESYAGTPAQSMQILAQGVSNLGQNIASKRAENALIGATQSYQDSLTGLITGGEMGLGTNYLGMLDTNPEKWESVSAPLSSADAYLKWKKGLSPRELRTAQKQGLVNPIAFKQLYDQQMAPIASGIARKVLDYRDTSFKTNKDMRKWLSDRGLDSYLRNTITDPMNPYYAEIKDMIQPDESWSRWAERKLTPDTAFGIAGAGIGASQAYQTAMPTLRGVGRLAGRGIDYSPSQIDDMAKMMKGKLGKGIDAKAGKQLTSAKATLTRAQNKFNKAKKSYKGKNFATTTKGPKSAKALQAKINAAKSGLNKATSNAGKGSVKVIQRYIKQHGTSGLVKALAKKLGTGGALKIAGKLGLGTALSGTLLGTGAGILLNAATAVQIANLIKELGE